MKFSMILFTFLLVGVRALAQDHFETAMSYVKSLQDTRVYFAHDVKDSSNISFCISDSVGGCLNFNLIEQLVEEQLGRKIRGGQGPDDSLLQAAYRIETELSDHEGTRFEPRLKGLSSQGKCDLLVEFGAPQQDRVFLTLHPFKNTYGWSYGMDFLFYFTGDSIRKVYTTLWMSQN
jgi:hypothetical protein